MNVQTQSLIEEFERRLAEARREVWRTVVGTDDELATLETHPAGASIEDASTIGVADLLARIDGIQRRRLDEIDAAQARLAARTFGTCERCATAIPLARLRAIPTARLCVACEREAEHSAPR